MPNTPYSHYELVDPEDLSSARYRWGPPEIVEEVEELKRVGFNSRTWGFVDPIKQATTQCRRHGALLADLEQLMEKLLTTGKLVAFGFTKDTLAGPQFIPPTIWKFAKVNYDTSILEIVGQPESTITSIVVFEDLDNPSIEPSKVLVRTWSKSLEDTYKERVTELIKTDTRSKREEDVAYMKGLFGDNVIHKRVYALRRKYYPLEWQKKGRPKKGKSE